jgi:hypothetical protein
MRRLESGEVDWMLVGFIATVVLAAACVVAAVAEAKDWDKFKIEHHCTKVAHISGDVFNTFSVGANGQMAIGIGSTPDKTGWRCDDGVTYFR